MRLYVFILRDPRDGQAKYVGLSERPFARLRETQPRVKLWLAILRKCGLRPHLDVRAYLPLTEARQMKNGLILDLLEQGAPLLNASVPRHFGVERVQEELQ